MKPNLPLQSGKFWWGVAIASTLTTVLSPLIAQGEPLPVDEDSAQNEPFSLETDVEAIIEAPETDKSIPEVEAQSNLETEALSTPSPVQNSPITILTPTQNAVLDIPSSAVSVRYPLEAKLELWINGERVNDDLIGRTETDSRNNVITQTWYGVGFSVGENTLTAKGTLHGVALPEVSFLVTVRDTPVKLTVESIESAIPADGRSTATLRGELLDKRGNRANRNAIITLHTSSGQFLGTDANLNAPGFQVEAEDGEYTATLQAGTQAGTVRIQATTVGLEGFTQLRLNPVLRADTLVSGVVDFRLGARGTDFYGSRKDFLPLDGDNSTQLNVRGAAFATGSLGEWQFTGAYNSDRALNEDCNCNNRIFGSYQSSELLYPAYGDRSKTEVVAPSIDSVYFRLERSSPVIQANPDYVMWGDYRTQEFTTRSQEFSAFARTLHGFKGNYTFGNLQVTGFYANNVEGFQRDTLPPDGTSGFYFLSRRLVRPGSENIFIELEELDRPGTVIRRQQLIRNIDYQIDYDRGTLLFNSPVFRTQIDEAGRILVRRIVATYQHETQGEDTNLVGGRVQYNFSRELNQETWLGATYLQENRGVRNFNLYGVDALVSLGENSQIIGEYAHSENDSEMMGRVQGSAMRFEALTKIGEWLQGRAYYRHADTGFANNATVSFVPGQTRYGAEVQARVSPTTNLRIQYDHEDNQGVAPRPLLTFGDLFTPRLEPVPGSEVNNRLTTITAGLQQQIGNANLSLDWIHRSREDRIAPNELSGNSNQLRSRLSLPLTEKLTLQAVNELSLSSETDPVFSDRTLFGLDWELYPGIRLSLAQNWFTRGQLAGQSLTTIGVSGEYKLGSDTILNARYGLIGSVDGFTTQGALGLKQGFTLAQGLRLNLAYEQVFDNFLNRTATGVQFLQPFAVGQGASALAVTGGSSYSAGIEYSNSPDFSARASLEHRTSSAGNNTVISAGATGKLSPALTALFNYRQASSANQRLQLGDSANLRLGIAYRDPSSDQFNALLRYEYRKNPSTIPETLLLGRGTGSEDHVFSAEGIYAPNWQWEFYGKYAFRNSTSYLASDLVGTGSVSLAQLRATYRLGYDFDLVGEARWINQPSANYSETGFLVEAGYYLSPHLRLAAGYAFGEVSDRDFSGTRSAGGPYLGFTVKLDGLLNNFHSPEIIPSQP